MRVAVALIAITLASGANAGAISFNFGEDAIGLALQTPVAPAAGIEIAGWHHEDDHDLGTVGVFAIGKRGKLQGSVGVKGYYADVDDFQGYGAAFGANVKLPLSDVLDLHGRAFIGPSVASADDADGYQEWGLSFEINLFGNSSLSLGYREVEFDVDGGGEFEFQDDVYLGLNLLF